MILVTVGTHEQPFDRLMNAVVALGDSEPMLVQYGTCTITNGPGEWVDFLPFDELEARTRGARVLVCHAGVGSIMLARRCGLKPVVMPRRHHLGEAVDDHQLPLAQRLARGPQVAIQFNKRLANADLLEKVNRVIDASLAMEAITFGTADHREAVRSFIEKRPPTFG